MIRFVYNLLYPIGLLLYLPIQISKLLRRGNFRHKIGQRFGVYDHHLRSRLASRRCTWIHAVSVGEVAVALKLCAKLKHLDPHFFGVLTTTTTTGFAVATRQAAEVMEVLYSPLDFWPIMRRAFRFIQPIRVVLIEAEVWPNLAAEASRRRIPLALVNARLSERSEKRFRRFRFLVKPTFQCLDLVCVQEPGDIERWVALGVARGRIHHVGSIKYDPEETGVPSETPSRVLQSFGIDGEFPILFGGSTHAGEEQLLGEILQDLRSRFPEIRLIIAPRHVERVAEISAQLRRLGLNVRLRSEAETGRPASLSPPDCVLLDSTGELQQWYSVATVVFVGKSLAVTGGQNPVEPVLAGKPVLFGPHMENFSALAKALVASGGAIQVSDPTSLRERIEWLLCNREAASDLVMNARAVLDLHRGATARTALLIVNLK